MHEYYPCFAVAPAFINENRIVVFNAIAKLISNNFCLYAHQTGVKCLLKILRNNIYSDDLNKLPPLLMNVANYELTINNIYQLITHLIGRKRNVYQAVSLDFLKYQNFHELSYESRISILDMISAFISSFITDNCHYWEPFVQAAIQYILLDHHNYENLYHCSNFLQKFFINCPESKEIIKKYLIKEIKKSSIKYIHIVFWTITLLFAITSDSSQMQEEIAKTKKKESLSLPPIEEIIKKMEANIQITVEKLNSYDKHITIDEVKSIIKNIPIENQIIIKDGTGKIFIQIMEIEKHGIPSTNEETNNDNISNNDNSSNNDNIIQNKTSIHESDDYFLSLSNNFNNTKNRSKCYIYSVVLTLLSLSNCQKYFHEMLSQINPNSKLSESFYRIMKPYILLSKDKIENFIEYLNKSTNSSEYNPELDDYDPINYLHNIIEQFQKITHENKIDIDPNQLDSFFTIKWKYNNCINSHYMIKLSSNEITERSIINSIIEMEGDLPNEIQADPQDEILIDSIDLEAPILTIQSLEKNFKSIPETVLVCGLQYNLISVIVHIGSGQSLQHFVTLFFMQEMWYFSDDDKIDILLPHEFDQLTNGNFGFIFNHTTKYIPNQIQITPYLFFYEKI